MKKLLQVCGVMLFVLSFVCTAQADFIDLPVKWSQVPWDPRGTDWLSDHTVDRVVADDFICDSRDPIVAVRWWGSYLGPQQPDGSRTFDISFHLSVPGPNAPHPLSKPGAIVYFATVTPQEALVGNDAAGIPVYRYDAYLPQPFRQAEWAGQSGIPGELWIDICKPTRESWGWHEVVPPHPRLDFAAVAPGHPGPWQNLETDMAFELMTPIPGAVWFLGSGLVGLLGLKRRRKG